MAKWRIPQSPLPSPLKLDVGCGDKKRDPQHIGLDLLDLPSVDILCDFDKEALPFPDASVDEIYTSHCIEHLQRPENLLGELFRVLKPGGLLNLRVPYYMSAEAFYLSHRFQFSEKWFDQALAVRAFEAVEYQYGWTKEIQDPSNPFHQYWLNPGQRAWCLRHLVNVAWEIWVRCRKAPAKPIP